KERALPQLEQTPVHDRRQLVCATHPEPKRSRAVRHLRPKPRPYRLQTYLPTHVATALSHLLPNLHRTINRCYPSRSSYPQPLSAAGRCSSRPNTRSSSCSPAVLAPGAEIAIAAVSAH